MVKDTVSLISEDEVVRALANKIQRDIERLQVAILKEHKHDIGHHLSNALERSFELTDILNETSSSFR